MSSQWKPVSWGVEVGCLLFLSLGSGFGGGGHGPSGFKRASMTMISGRSERCSNSPQHRPQ